MNKKGLFSTDFTISLGIFILFIGWFVLFIRPVFQGTNNLDPMFELFEEKMTDSFVWEVQRLPVVIISPYNLNNHGVVSEFNYGWVSNNSGFYDKTPFEIVDNKLYFLSNLSQGANVKLLSHSEGVYEPQTQFTRADFSEHISNVDNLKIEFLNSIPKNITYDGNLRIRDMIYKLRGDMPEIRASYFKDYLFFSMHYIDLGAINISHVVFLDNTRILGFIKQKTISTQNNVTIKMDLLGYNNFHSNNVFKGELDYENKVCYSDQEQYINFYDSSDSVTIYFSKPVIINFCTIKDSSLVEIEFSLDLQDLDYEIMFHQGDYKVTKNIIDIFEVKYGPVEFYNEFSEQKVNETLNKTYSTLKSEIPQLTDENFNICVSKIDGTTEISKSCVGDELPLSGNIISEEKRCNFISSYGEILDCKMLLQVW